MIKFQSVDPKDPPVVTYKARIDEDEDLVLAATIQDHVVPLLCIDHKTGYLKSFRLSKRSLDALHEAGFKTKNGRLCAEGFATAD